jgi:hypothetical protein
MTATSSDIKLGGRSHQKWGGAAEALSAINCAAPDRKWDIRTVSKQVLGRLSPTNHGDSRQDDRAESIVHLLPRKMLRQTEKLVSTNPKVKITTQILWSWVGQTKSAECAMAPVHHVHSAEAELYSFRREQFSQINKSFLTHLKKVMAVLDLISGDV